MSAIALERGDWLPAIRPLPAGQAVAAVGDVHGQDDLFAALSRGLVREMADASHTTFVQLGDVVDRGPGSIAALRRARLGVPGVECVTIMGNHEDSMLRALLSGDKQEATLWRDCGGVDTLAELGFSMKDPDWRTKFAKALGNPFVEWLISLPKCYRLGDLLFVHAGINPDLPLARQDAKTLMWTRRPFIDSPGPYPDNVAIIHGHTPQRTLDLSHPHRINLDTGAFRTGVLSGLVVVGDRMRSVQAVRQG